jgi:uncharacterized protein YndB with AHSA1/START domain
MNDLSITYVVYIATTAQNLWEALTSPEVLRNNWGKIESEWTKGSRVTEVDDSGKVLWKGEVRRSEPPHVLSYTFDVTGTGEPPTEVSLNSVLPTPRSHKGRRSCSYASHRQDLRRTARSALVVHGRGLKS